MLKGQDKKYFKRSDLIEKEREEYIEKYLSAEVAQTSNSKIHVRAKNNSDEKDPRTQNDELNNLQRSEVMRKLRERGEPILLFGESELDSCRRLRLLEISAPEVNLGYRNDFQQAMDAVDQAYLQEMLIDNPVDPNKDKNKNEDIDLDSSITYESLQEKAPQLGRGDKQHDIDVCLNLLKLLLCKWNDQVNTVVNEKMKTKTKIARATFTQTRVYLKPLLKKLKNNKIPEDIFDSLTEIIKHLLKRDYIAASDAYLTMAIGNAPWPIGVTMVGIHARTGREKIFSKNVAHVLNDETQRKYIQGLKRLMTKCQEFFPTDPSRSVEYVSKKDLDKEKE